MDDHGQNMGHDMEELTDMACWNLGLLRCFVMLSIGLAWTSFRIPWNSGSARSCRVWGFMARRPRKSGPNKPPVRHSKRFKMCAAPRMQ